VTGSQVDLLGSTSRTSVFSWYQPRGHPDFGHLADLAGEWPPHHPIRQVITVMVLFFGGGQHPGSTSADRPPASTCSSSRGSVPAAVDVTSISVYLTGSVIYSHLPVDSRRSAGSRPDQRPRAALSTRLLALGWSVDRITAVAHLEKLIAIMPSPLSPIACPCTPVVSFVFAHDGPPMWHSAIFGLNFVEGAISLRHRRS